LPRITDDFAVISGETTGFIDEGDIGDNGDTVSGTLLITDVDRNDAPNFANVASAVGDNGFGSFLLTNNRWFYTLDQLVVQDLDQGDEVTDTITFTA